MKNKAKSLDMGEIREVDRGIEECSEKIGISLTKLLFDEEVDATEMVSLLCAGIIGLTLSTSKRRELTTAGAKEDLSKFVMKEMERVRKQHGLRKSDVYRA